MGSETHAALCILWASVYMKEACLRMAPKGQLGGGAWTPACDAGKIHTLQHPKSTTIVIHV